jgi:translation initiation factor 2 subunit 1
MYNVNDIITKTNIIINISPILHYNIYDTEIEYNTSFISESPTYYPQNGLFEIKNGPIGINISEYGIEVSLNEYNNIKGFINCSEVSRKKKVNLNKLLTVGKDILLNVIQVDKEKGFIDLSKRTISDEDIKLFNEKHKLHIQLYNLFKHIYMKLYNIDSHEKIQEEDLYTFMCSTLWEIQTEYENEFILEKILNKESNLEIIDIIDFDMLNISKDQIEKILNDYIDEKINRTNPELNESIKLMTYNCTGLADIKYALDYKNFIEYIDLEKDFLIKINYISGSVYSIIIEQKNFNLNGQINIDDAILIIKKEIKKRSIEKSIQNQIVI